MLRSIGISSAAINPSLATLEYSTRRSGRATHKCLFEEAALTTSGTTVTQTSKLNGTLNGPNRLSGRPSQAYQEAAL
jgi:hypothetical protein